MTQQVGVQLRFESKERLQQAVEHLEYWISLPLPEEVTQNEVHQERRKFLVGLRGVLSLCYQKTLEVESNTPGTKFGSGGSVSVEPPTEG